MLFNISIWWSIWMNDKPICIPVEWSANTTLSMNYTKRKYSDTIICFGLSFHKILPPSHDCYYHSSFPPNCEFCLYLLNPFFLPPCQCSSPSSSLLFASHSLTLPTYIYVHYWLIHYYSNLLQVFPSVIFELRSSHYIVHFLFQILCLSWRLF